MPDIRWVQKSFSIEFRINNRGGQRRPRQKGRRQKFLGRTPSKKVLSTRRKKPRHISLPDSFCIIIPTYFVASFIESSHSRLAIMDSEKSDPFPTQHFRAPRASLTGRNRGKFLVFEFLLHGTTSMSLVLPEGASMPRPADQSGPFDLAQKEFFPFQTQVHTGAHNRIRGKTAGMKSSSKPRLHSSGVPLMQCASGNSSKPYRAAGHQAQ